MEKIHKDSEFITDKFVEYQHKAKAVYLDFLLNYSVEMCLSIDEIFFMLFFFGFSYSELDAIYFLETFDSSKMQDLEYLEKYRYENNKFFNFCSARTKFQSKKAFTTAINSYRKNIGNAGAYKIVMEVLSNTCCDSLLSIQEMEQRLKKITYIGDFSARKFVEVLEYIGKFGSQKILSYFENTGKVDWTASKNMTLGALRCMAEKETHDKFERTGKLNQDEVNRLNAFLEKASEKIEKYEKSWRVSQNVYLQKLCSFENLYKNKRYGGYHHDRQLQNLYRKRDAGIDKDYLRRMFELRKESYSEEMLGEIGGWDGIRKGMKDLWTEQGKTGVEKGFIGKDFRYKQ